MTRYLILAHQTASSRELAAAVQDLASRDPDARFTLVVPASPVGYWSTWEELSARAFAEEQGRRAIENFERAGVHGVELRIGNRYPLDALADELRDGPGYDELVISTFPAGASRWLKRDLPHQAARRSGLPVTHVTARAPALART